MKLIKVVVNKIDFIVFCTSIFTLSQSIKLSSKLLFIALALGVTKSIYHKDFTWFAKHKLLIFIYGGFFSYICIQGIYLDGAMSFLNSFEKHYAPYLVFLLIPFLYRDNAQVKMIPKVFVAGLFFTFFLIVLLSILQLQPYDRNKVLEVFDLHHLYMSLYILFSINYLLSTLLNDILGKKKVPVILMLLILVGFLAFFKSKAAIVVFIILLGYHVFIKIKRNILTNVAIATIMVTILVVFNNFFLELYLTALDFRVRIWSEATKAISQNLFFGYGSANEYLQLNTAHFLNGNFDFLDSNYNSHNQYLSFALKFGLIGLLLILAAYIIPYNKMRTSFRKEYLGFLIVLFFMAFIESLFNRHHGIVFCSIMLYYYNSMCKNELK